MLPLHRDDRTCCRPSNTVQQISSSSGSFTTIERRLCCPRHRRRRRRSIRSTRSISKPSISALLAGFDLGRSSASRTYTPPWRCLRFITLVAGTSNLYHVRCQHSHRPKLAQVCLVLAAASLRVESASARRTSSISSLNETLSTSSVSRFRLLKLTCDLVLVHS
ncbi:hypothetical protein EJ03DRAFT_28394 [Teratosphaeria nubilosa]|uniref:Uncharacterized protein n=1 Tax=Teratosphaeria nubilosa TaxID=161662 RepID=A0A6G1KVU8_9PEZI|nr:hypothetical protein EJ03DRAFT_28394 [Teratosphaeria nubilosa]